MPHGAGQWRWPDGFVCPHCGGRRHSEIKTRALYQCTACRRQTSLIAGTIFAAIKLPLRSWFRALYHLTQSKQGISSLELMAEISECGMQPAGVVDSVDEARKIGYDASKLS